MPILLCIVCNCFHAKTAEVSNYNRGHVACKAENNCYPALHRTSLSTPGLQGKYLFTTITEWWDKYMSKTYDPDLDPLSLDLHSIIKFLLKKSVGLARPSALCHPKVCWLLPLWLSSKRMPRSPTLDPRLFQHHTCSWVSLPPPKTVKIPYMPLTPNPHLWPLLSFNPLYLPTPHGDPTWPLNKSRTELTIYRLQVSTSLPSLSVTGIFIPITWASDWSPTKLFPPHLTYPNPFISHSNYYF